MASGCHQIKLGALHPKRDFNNVKDTVRGFIAIAEAERSVGEVINIGSSYEITIGDMVQLLSEIMSVEIRVEIEPVRLRPDKGEVARLWADNSKAKRLLGWEPVYYGYDGLKRGLTETAAWFGDPHNLKKYKTYLYNM
jgi:dTDP-glucose 4,6-dehydratase